MLTKNNKTGFSLKFSCSSRMATETSESKDSSSKSITVRNAFVVVTKWPTEKKSKTRLAAHIGDKLAVNFVRTALQDLIVYFSKEIKKLNKLHARKKTNIVFEKFVLFTPNKNRDDLLNLIENGLKEFETELSNDWNLIAMKNENMKTSNLTDKLNCCFDDLYSNKYNINGSITCIASDSFDIRLSHLNLCLLHSNNHRAYIIPAIDGGYVMLSCPYLDATNIIYKNARNDKNGNVKIFNNVHWSSNDTCISQIEAFKNCGIDCVKSKEILMDIDEIDDWIILCNRFGIDWKQSQNKNNNNENDDDVKDDAKENEQVSKETILDYRWCFPKTFRLIAKQVQHAQVNNVQG